MAEAVSKDNLDKPTPANRSRALKLKTRGLAHLRLAAPVASLARLFNAGLARRRVRAGEPEGASGQREYLRVAAPAPALAPLFNAALAWRRVRAGEPEGASGQREY